MENNKGYLRHFGLILLITFLSAVAVEIVAAEFLRDEDGYYSSNMAWAYALYSIPAILFYLALGIATKKWTAAICATGVFVIIQVIEYLLLEKERIGEDINRSLYFFLLQLSYLLPYVVFFALAKTNTKKLPTILFISFVLQIGDNALFRPGEGFDFLDDVFMMDLNIPDYVFSVLTFTIGPIIRLIIVCELINYGENKNKGWNVHLINPGNEYDKVNATILFWVLKSGIYFSLLGCISYLRTFDDLFSGNYSSAYDDIKLQYFLTLFFLIFTLLAIAWYLRKFMLEYFASYNFTSRFLYWFLLLPFIGFFIWLGMLADSRKQETFNERERSIQGFSASKPDGIIVVFVILMVLRFSLALTYNFPAEFIISTILSIGLFIWMVKSRIGYYVNLYLNLFLVVLILLLIFFNAAESSIFLLYPILLLNTVQLVLIYPAFHFDAFNYISYEEEKPWQPGQDLF